MRIKTHWASLAGALAMTLTVAACGGGGSPPAMAPGPDPALGAAKMAAMAAATAAGMAADAAEMAADAAEMAADAQMANQAADPASYGVAQNAAMRAREAANAAQAASDAAEAADDTAAAQAQQAIAEAKQAEAETEQANAEMYAGMVQTAQQVIDDAAAEAAALATAKTAADAAAIAAEAAADKAEAAAMKVAELTGDGSQQYMDAQAAATAARMAATAAREASDMAQAAMESGAAQGHQATAETQQGTAETQYASADELRREAQVAADAGNVQQEQRDIADAQDAAKAAADEAMTHYMAAMGKATDARSQATMARDAAIRAMSARTNYERADAQATAAETAASEAEAARDRARTANADAQTAYMDAMSAETAADAEAAQMAAEAANEVATEQHTGMTGAGMAYMRAKDAAMKAEMYSNNHVVGLLMMANARHLTVHPDPNAQADELSVIEKNRLNHVANVNTAVHATSGGTLNTGVTAVENQGGGTVTATWSYYTSLGADSALGGTGTNADTGPGEGKPMISVDPGGDGGDAVALQHAGPGATDATTDDLTNNFGQGPGLGVFTHEKYVHGLNATTTDDLNDANNQRIILFTDKMQGSAGRAPETVSYFGEPVVQSRIATVDTGTPVADTERDYNATYDHDGNSATAPIAVVLNCGTTCNLRVVNGDIVSISGYTFSTAGDVNVAAVAPVDDDTWLAFGIWLTETVVADGVNTYAFGAFADGGAAIGDSGEPSAVASVTGDATYRGKAAGVHSTATAVDFFHADATLTAKFGNGTDIGTITGMIHNIMSGGDPVTGSIDLVVADPGAATPTPNIVDAGTFTGRARMHDTGMDDDSGEDIYRYTGTWGGTFYNHMENDTDTADVDESTRAPGSVAGTFGVGRADVATTRDVDETESYVGAFGAHCSGSNCNPH